LDDDFLAEAREQNWEAGSTLLMGLVHGNEYTVANIGDSSALLLKQSGLVHKLTYDQTPARPDE